jgi:phospholipid/cholesterol/gamma-HCH transport system permease protein
MGDSSVASAPASAPAPLAGRGRQLDERGWFRVASQIAGIVGFSVAVVRSLVTPPFSWRREFVDQLSLLLWRCLIPVALSAFAFGFGTAGIGGGSINDPLGAIDRLGMNFSTGAVREFVPWITGMVLAGVGGTAICADLGARKIREELDALAVIGTDVIRTLIAPTVLAMTVVPVFLFMIGIAFAILAGMVVTSVVYNAPVAGFLATFSINFVTVELFGGLLKTILFGFIVGIICSYKGMNVSGGSEGVGRGVNQAVVLAFVTIWIVNYAWTATELAAFPELLSIR